MNLCVIPARGGSKRIPRKNIRNFSGKPMIAWSIEAAIASKLFERIIVSTDDTEIAQIAIKHGAEVPFVRPSELADDHTPTIPVIAHAIQWFAQVQLSVEYTCCIYATAPFVNSDDIKRAYQKLVSSNCDYVFTVTSYPFPIQRAIRILENDRIDMFQPEHALTRSQDLEDSYHDAGQFYWGKSEAWTLGMMIFGSNSAPWILPRYRVQDVDNAEDWARAEWLFRAMKDQSK